MDQMSDVQRLIEIEAIKSLKSRRDRAVDNKDWAAFEAMHAPDHYSHADDFPPWTSAKELVQNVMATLETVTTVHHSHTPDITFQAPDKASGTWAMEDNLYWKQGDEDHWLRGFGFYEERYEKRDGRWVFVYRRLKRIKVLTSPGAIFPPPKKA
jgi:hypothetical protein